MTLPSVETNPAATPAASLPEHPIRILLAEDDREMRALVEQHLRANGYDVESCHDGFELLQHIGSFSDEDRPADFSLILSDIRMPGFTGLEILDFMHANGGFPPVILITAFGDERTHSEAERLGVAAVLDKPFDLDHLTAVIQRVLTARDSAHPASPAPPSPDRGPFPLELIFRGYPRLPELDLKIRQAAESLDRYRPDILFCRVVVTANNRVDRDAAFDVRSIVTVPGKVFVVGLANVARERSHGLTDAVTEIFAILEGRMRKYYERFPPVPLQGLDRAPLNRVEPFI